MTTTCADQDAIEDMSETAQAESTPRWRLPAWALAVVLAAASVTTALILRSPFKKSVTVFALFYVAAGDESSADRKGRSGNESLYRQTQVNLIKSRAVLDPALQLPAIAGLSVVHEQPNPIAWLEREIQVEARENTRTIRVALTGDRPAELAAIVNAVAQTYLREVVVDERTQRQMRLAECERIHKENLDQLYKNLEELQTLSRRSLDDRPTGGLTQQTAMERAATLQKEMEAVTTKLEKMKIQLTFERKKQKSGITEKVPDLLIDEQLDRDPAAQKLAAQRDRFKRIIGQYEKEGKTGPNTSQLVSSSLKAYRSDLQSTEKQLEKRRTEIREVLEKQMRLSNRQSADQSAKQLEEQIELYQEEEKLLRRRFDEQVREVEKNSRASWVEMEKLLKEIDRRQAVIKTFGEECAMLRREITTAPRVTLVQEATAGE